jgi:hypothetical protein
MKSTFCDNEACRGKFGLVIQRWMAYRFCSKKCKEDFLAKLTAHRRRMHQWLTFLEPPIN